MFNKILFSLALVAASSSAYAASEAVATVPGTAAGTSEAASTASSSSFMDRVYINYFGFFRGPQTTNLSGPYTPNAKGQMPKAETPDGNGNIGFDSDLTAAWMLTKDVGVGAYFQYWLYPIRGHGITLGDYGVKVFDKHFIRTSNFNMYSNLIVELPAGYDDARGVDVKIKMTPNVRYDFAGTRFSAGMWTEQAFYPGVSDKIHNNKQIKFIFNPYVLYQLDPKWALNLSYNMEYDHMAGNPGSFLNYTMAETDLIPGFVYRVSPKIVVNPYIQFYTTEKIALDRSSLGATISATL